MSNCPGCGSGRLEWNIDGREEIFNEWGACANWLFLRRAPVMKVFNPLTFPELKTSWAVLSAQRIYARSIPSTLIINKRRSRIPSPTHSTTQH